eukprot:TRINITY_DN39762_c0_g1_i2.p1 TRINITY_DN39762_c0_g1~~TRINITY_DN39762_c0_g1_i2.p1  ORF type:complete len:176 (-),score=41.99 TRINITY_DN39762_c0_g1_i2:209-736(-)
MQRRCSRPQPVLATWNRCLNFAAFCVLNLTLASAADIFLADYVSGCDDERVARCDEDGDIVSVDLTAKQLVGTLGGFEAFPFLRVLKLGENRLTGVDASVGSLSNLEELNLSNNHISKLPAELSKLAQLKNLYLGSNFLAKLPGGIDRLYSLERCRCQSLRTTTRHTSVVLTRSS